MNEKINATVAPVDAGDAADTAILFHYWQEWIDEMYGHARVLSPATRAFLDLYQTTKTAPIALMFAAFEAGMDKGLELAMEVDTRTR